MAMPEYTPAPAPSKAEFDSLANDVSTLNGKIATSSVDISSTISNPNGDFNGCVKSGNCVMLSIGAGTNLISGGAVATVPTGYRPSTFRYIRFGGMASQNGSSWEPIAVGVNTNGEVCPYMLTSNPYSVVRIGMIYVI